MALEFSLRMSSTYQLADRTRAVAGCELGRSVIMIGAEYGEARLAGNYLAADLIVFPAPSGCDSNTRRPNTELADSLTKLSLTYCDQLKVT